MCFIRISIGCVRQAYTQILLCLILIVMPCCGKHEQDVRARYKTKNYSINTNHYEVYPIVKSGFPKDWTPNLTLDLDDALPFPWPDKYITLFKQPFAPWSFFRNAAALYNYYSQTGDVTALDLMEKLYARFLEYTLEDNEQMFVLYRFKKPYRGIDVAVPWTSAYASGAALIGLTLMNECLGKAEILQVARKILGGLGGAIDTRETRPRYWVSFVDPHGFLWFEEMPLDQETQPRILNGHIRAITGLYIYYVFTKDQMALDLLRSGIRTVEEYTPYYRKEGKVNAYDLLEPYIPDYGPYRTIDQQRMIWKMTGETIFKTYSDLFESDISEHLRVSP
jgi:hypothetical protein